jgi:hypothetical protein
MDIDRALLRLVSGRSVTRLRPAFDWVVLRVNHRGQDSPRAPSEVRVN